MNSMESTESMDKRSAAVLDSDSIHRLTEHMYDMQLIDIMGDALDFITKYRFRASEHESDIIGAACLVADRVGDLMDAVEHLETLKRG